MLKFLIGFILGVLVSAGGFTFTDAAAYVTKGAVYLDKFADKWEEEAGNGPAKVEKQVDAKK